jgi:hypothetical protein
MRTMSDFIMMSRLQRCHNNPSRLCPQPSLLEQVRLELQTAGWRRPECFFNSTVRHWPLLRICSTPRHAARRNALTSTC